MLTWSLIPASAVVPSLLLMWYFHARDLFREPAKVLWATFGLGVAITGLIHERLDLVQAVHHDVQATHFEYGIFGEYVVQALPGAIVYGIAVAAGQFVQFQLVSQGKRRHRSAVPVVRFALLEERHHRLNTVIGHHQQGLVAVFHRQCRIQATRIDSGIDRLLGQAQAHG